MTIPHSVSTALNSLPVDQQRNFRRDWRRREKKLGMAYLAWLLLGWHYLYLGRVGVQFAFWFTLGFLVIGWFVDFFRLPGMVRQMNEDNARNLMMEYKMMLR
jgi:TM2 domain